MSNNALTTNTTAEQTRTYSGHVETGRVIRLAVAYAKGATGVLPPNSCMIVHNNNIIVSGKAILLLKIVENL